ncbi:MAG: hypothetical protein V1802_01710 [Candidatus Aenigmatarchaeota archaeon]
MINKFCIVIIVLLMLLPVAFAHTVTMNFAFNMSANKQDTVHVNGFNYDAGEEIKLNFADMEKKYISSQTNDIVSALISAGSGFISLGFDSHYSPSSYMFNISQSHKKNRFILAFTNGTWESIDKKTTDIESSGIISSAFSPFRAAAPAMQTVFLRLAYSNIDIASRIHLLGNVNLLVKNAGKSDGRTKIIIEVIE